MPTAATKITHSILLTGPSGAGKSYFARKALEAVGSGMVLASPIDELDSYLGLEAPRFLFKAIDDHGYTPSLKGTEGGIGAPGGSKEGIYWLRARYAEIADDVKNGKPPRYGALVLDTISAMGTLAQNAAMAQYSLTEPPPAMSPGGAAFYTFMRMRQEELLRLARAFRGFGVHLIALSHEVDTEVGEEKIAKTTPGKTRMQIPALPGGLKTIVSSYFSTVLHAGVMPGQNDTRLHYVQWKPDPKRATKNRFGDLDPNDKIRNDWTVVVGKIEEAAARRLNPSPAAT
jgi:AAA domain-containing protein